MGKEFTCSAQGIPASRASGSIYYQVLAIVKAGLSNSIEWQVTYSEHVRPKQNCMLSDIKLCLATVNKALKSLKPKCSYGPDGLRRILLYSFARVLSKPLSFIFHSSFRFGVLLACWLDALVTPGI